MKYYYDKANLSEMGTELLTMNWDEILSVLRPPMFATDKCLLNLEMWNTSQTNLNKVNKKQTKSKPAVQYLFNISNDRQNWIIY